MGFPVEEFLDSISKTHFTQVQMLLHEQRLTLELQKDYI
jgi:hypothetical protein